MQTFNIHEAKTHLSRLVEKVAGGESFIIAKSGKPIARVVPLDTPTLNEKKRLGFLKNEISAPDDFNDMGGTAIEQLFAGGQ